MTDRENEKAVSQDVSEEAFRNNLNSYSNSDEAAGQPVPPPNWRHRSFRLGSIRIPWYASPPTQLVLVGLVCFLCPGMFNALAGLGGAGQVDPATANNANVALYSTFSVVGFFAGSVVNRLGVKFTLSFGGFGYCLYVASFLSYNHDKNAGFSIFAGALLGVCAGLLWSAQGAIMTSYPPEGSKGRYIAWFWMIFNLGSVIGSLIPLGQNLHSSSGTVTDGTYIAFIVLTFLGAILAWFLVDAQRIIRSDGSRVVLMKHPTWQSELVGLWQVFRSDSYIILLFPMFFASNWFYTYQFNSVNLAKFNIRTRALNNTLYWTSQIIGAYTFGYSLDIISVRRTTKARASWVVLFVITMAIWGGGYAWQRQYTRSEVTQKGYIKEDWTTSGYVGPMFLFMFYGFYDAAWQTCVYWYMGALTNSGRKLANFIGFYKGIQSAAAAIIYRIDALDTPFINEFASCWALLAGALIIAGPVIMTKVRDTVPLADDLAFSDETVEDVQATAPEVVHEKA